jgi:hypothetical protein
MGVEGHGPVANLPARKTKRNTQAHSERAIAKGTPNTVLEAGDDENTQHGTITRRKTQKRTRKQKRSEFASNRCHAFGNKLQILSIRNITESNTFGESRNRPFAASWTVTRHRLR